jgi:hypothetical protein
LIGVGALGDGSKRSLVVLFIPSVERDGLTAIDQERWVQAALELMGHLFGGATAYPKARGVWRDDERSGALVFDAPVLLHSYVTPEALNDEANLAKLLEFCCKLGRETRQGEIGLVIEDEYFPITNFGEE